MNSGTIDLIATDPPFNKGKDFHATPDSLASGAKFQDRWSWAKDVHEDWVDQIKDDNPKLMEAIESARYAHSDGMGAFMCFMAVRLMSMQRLLKSTGSIYLHCDPTASHYLKAVMDAIFGWKNFRNEIIWCYRGAGYPKNDFGKRHDIILKYSKSKEYVFNLDAVRMPYAQATIERFKHKIGNVRGGIDYGQQSLDKKGRHPDDWWEIQPIAPSSKERLGYPTQKPLELYERIIKASSNEGDWILDPFAGCGTTCVGAEKLGRQWVGIDIWSKAHKVVVKLLESKCTNFFGGEVNYTKELPIRTDDGETAAPHLQVKEKVKEPEGQKMSRAEMYDHLLSQHGAICQGCDREFDDSRYLELDHNTPRSDGGINHLSNRILLCSPCNRLKSNTYTLSGLRKENKNKGYMRT